MTKSRYAICVLVAIAILELVMILDRDHEIERLKTERDQIIETAFNANGATAEYYCKKLRQHGIEP
jgi:hypothetical protein